MRNLGPFIKSSIVTFTLALALSATNTQAADRDLLVGSGGQSCFKAKQVFSGYDVERDQAIDLIRAVVEQSRIDNKEEKIKELSAPVIEKHKLVTDAYKNQLREFALGMLQAELLKDNADPKLLELENFNYVAKFLELCQNGGPGNDVLYHAFVTQVLEGNHKVLWLRATR